MSVASWLQSHRRPDHGDMPPFALMWAIVGTVYATPPALGLALWLLGHQLPLVSNLMFGVAALAAALAFGKAYLRWPTGSKDGSA
jgi:hypothetical protein